MIFQFYMQRNGAGPLILQDLKLHAGSFEENVLFMNITLEKCRAAVLHTAYGSSTHSILMLVKSSTRLLSTTKGEHASQTE